MDGLLNEALEGLFSRGVIELRRPQFKSLPFKVDMEKLETDPLARDAVFRLLNARLDARAYDCIASVPDDCKALAAIYADRCGARFLTPIEVVHDEKAPVMLYGEVPQEGCALVIMAYNHPYRYANIETHPVIRTLNVLRSKRCNVHRIVTIVDADKEARLRKGVMALPGRQVMIDTIFDMRDVLRILLASPKSFDVRTEEVQDAKEHYERL